MWIIQRHCDVFPNNKSRITKYLKDLLNKMRAFRSGDKEEIKWEQIELSKLLGDGKNLYTGKLESMLQQNNVKEPGVA